MLATRVHVMTMIRVGNKKDKVGVYKVGVSSTKFTPYFSYLVLLGMLKWWPQYSRCMKLTHHIPVTLSRREAKASFFYLPCVKRAVRLPACEKRGTGNKAKGDTKVGTCLEYVVQLTPIRL